MNIDLENVNMLPKMLQLIEKIKEDINANTAKRWMNVRELAQYLGYSKERIYKIKDEYLLEGEHFHNRTGKILFDRVAIDSWVVGKETDETNESQRQIVDYILSSVKEV